MRMSVLPALGFLVALCAPAPADAALRVFACEPEWGAMVQELGGEAVDVDVATSALQDVHHRQNGADAFLRRES